MVLNPKKTEIKCPECHNRLSSELVETILRGTDVYCETCGFLFTGIQQGEVKPLAESEKQVAVPQELSKRENQWLKWKEEWNSFRNKWVNPQEQGSSPSSTPSRIQSQEKNSSESKSTINTQASSSKAPITPIVSPVPQYTPGEIDIREKTLQGTKNALRVVVSLTPLFYFVMIISSIATMAVSASVGDTPMLLSTVGSFLLEIIIIALDGNHFLPRERNGTVSHAGLSMIFIGALTIRGFGIGLPLLVRGILHLIIFINYASIHNPNHPAVNKSKPQQVIWLREILRSIFPNLTIVLFGLWLSGILFSASVSLVIGTEDYAGATISLSTFMFIVYLIGFRCISETDIERFANEHWLGYIIMGIISVGNGFGIPLIFVGIIMALYRDSLKHQYEPLPVWHDISEALSIQQGQVPQSAQNVQNPRIRVVSVPSQRMDMAESQKLTGAEVFYNPDTGEPIRRFDPETGKLIAPVPAPKQKPLPGAILGQVFTILEPDVRTKLIELEIPVVEKDEVARSFIYLTHEQQLRYITELEQVNQGIDNQTQVYIRRISALRIPAEQREFLISQLDYIPFEKQEEFVKYIEQTAPISK